VCWVWEKGVVRFFKVVVYRYVPSAVRFWSAQGKLVTSHVVGLVRLNIKALAKELLLNCTANYGIGVCRFAKMSVIKWNSQMSKLEFFCTS
jgi:hypothetical protein